MPGCSLPTDVGSAESVPTGEPAAAPDALLAIDTAGAIVFINDQAEELFGWPADDLIGQDIEVVVPEVAPGSPLSGQRRDGTVFPAEISRSALHSRDQVLILVVVRDVTERVEAEQASRREGLKVQRERFDRLQSLGQLAGGVAHDFNNLLGVILNYSTLLSRRLTDDVAIADVGQITAAAERAAALTRQLLAFARRDVAHREPLDVNQLIEDFAPLLRGTLGEDFDLQLDLAAGQLVVLADRQQLEQVLLNLGINSRDAMSAGGVLTITTKVVSEQVVIAVADTGVGMEPEILARALEPFFTTKPPGSGTGLGLATVFGIVTQNGGQIGIVSSPNEGTTVSFSLPRVESAAVMHQRASGVEGGTERLLLVEDEESLRFVTERILAARGYEVLTASNGVEALEIFDRYGGAIDLVVTDVVMPLMRGDELGRRLLERQPTVRLLMMSGYVAGDVPPPGRLLEKPVSEADLLGAVREVLDATPDLDG
jgi:signal transduction histidine kinase